MPISPGLDLIFKTVSDPASFQAFWILPTDHKAEVPHLAQCGCTWKRATRKNDVWYGEVKDLRDAGDIGKFVAVVKLNPSAVYGKDSSVGSYDRAAAGAPVDDHGCEEARAWQEDFVASLWMVFTEHALEETGIEPDDLRLAGLYLGLLESIRAYRASDR